MTGKGILRPDPPAASLLAECEEGPPVPVGDVPLDTLAPVVKGRDKAATECRSRHKGLAAWARKLTGLE